MGEQPAACQQVQRAAGLRGDVGLQRLGPCGRLHFRAGAQLDALLGRGTGDAQRRGEAGLAHFA